MTVGVNDVEESHDGGILHFLEQGNLANRGARNTLIFSFEPNLLQSNDASGIGEISSLVNDTIGAFGSSQLQCKEMVSFDRKCEQNPVKFERTFANLFQLLVVIHGC